MRHLQQQGIDIQIAWSSGHAAIVCNEIADRLAKEAAQEAEDMESVEHYIQECQNYEDLRERLSVKLHQLTGICEWTPALFLDLRMKNKNEEFRLQLTETFDEFLERSKQFLKI